MVKFSISQIHECMTKSQNIRNLSVIAHIDAGKCFRHDQLVMMNDGTSKAVSSLKIGDLLKGDDFTSREILELHSGHGMIYKVTHGNQSPYYVNANHILCLRATKCESSVFNGSHDSKTNIVELSVSDFLDLSIDYKNALRGYDAYNNLYPITITPTTKNIYFGFQVNKNGRFLLPDYTVVHNSTVTDSLLNKAGIISDKDTGVKRGTDTRKDEQERGITIKSTGISLYYTLEDEQVPSGSDGNGFLINLIDSPGHMDFSSEVSAALRVTDGCLVIICCVKGICVQTETVLKQALNELIKPIVMMNKLDRLIMELDLSSEEVYQQLYLHLSRLNSFIEMHNSANLNINLHPSKCNIAFGCGLMGWGFSLRTFAEKWTVKLNKTVDELLVLFWGENYFNTKTGTWHKEPGTNRARGFCYFVIRPIIRIIKTVFKGTKEEINTLITNMDIKLSMDEKNNTGKDLLKLVMQKFLPNANALLEMIIQKLPSPVEAQNYRYKHLYTGPKDDKVAQGIKNCDPNGPLCMYVSKLFPSADMSRFYAFGRVFSGTVKSDIAYIQLPEYIVGNNNGLHKTRIQNVVVMMGDKPETVTNCPAGNTIALMGVDEFIIKDATITNVLGTHNIKGMSFAVSPVVSSAIKCKNAADLPKLIKGLALLHKSDPLCVVTRDKDTQEIIISGAGELHLEICINDLRTMYTRGIEIISSPPVVPFRETIINKSPKDCLAKSSTKLNRIYSRASPMDPNLVSELKTGSITTKSSNFEKGELFRKYGWSTDEARKIKSFSTNNTNILVDSTRAIPYLNETIDTISSSFVETTEKGPLCGEEVIGVRFDLTDAMFHCDAMHRGSAEIIPTTRRSLTASMLTADIRLMEPIYLVEVSSPLDCIGKIYNVVARRNGSVINESQSIETNSAQLQAYLPVASSFQFSSELLGETSGKAFSSLCFDHWKVIEDDPLQPGTRSNEIALNVRKRKGMKEEIPLPEKFIDKL